MLNEETKTVGEDGNDDLEIYTLHQDQTKVSSFRTRPRLV